MNGKRISIRNVPIGKTGLRLISVCPGIFQWDEPEKTFTIYILTGIFREFVVNGKQLRKHTKRIEIHQLQIKNRDLLNPCSQSSVF